MHYVFFVLFIIIISYLILISMKIITEPFHSIQMKPKLWVYWETKPGYTMPDYIRLCIMSMYKHCFRSFDVILLDEKKIYDYLPELHTVPFDLSKLLIAQKVDYYRVLLLKKYGGLYLDADTLVMRDPIEIIDKLIDYDYVGFGCTGMICNYGYGKPSNGIMASRANGKLVTRVVANLENKLSNDNNKKFEYFDLGKYIIWDELDKLIKNENYQYYHYSNDYDGTRDINGKWMTSAKLFSNNPIKYKHPDKLLFIVLYNSQMNDLHSLTEYELMNMKMNISNFFRKSLLEKII